MAFRAVHVIDLWGCKMAEQQEEFVKERDFQFRRLENYSKEDLIQIIIQLKKEKATVLSEIERLKGKGNSKEILESKEATTGPGRDETQSQTACKFTRDQRKKQQKPFDFSRYNKRHVALKVAYLGWSFHGFASQENVENTVEAHLFEALTKCCLIEDRAGCNYSRCGRTDKGVSAFGQVISVDVRSNLLDGVGVVQQNTDKVKERVGAKEPQEISYVHVLNKVLPDEIRVIGWAPVLPSFDARFSCLYRQYKYYFPASDMDIEMMNQAAQKFIGEHDFRNFCKMDVANGVVNFRRSIRQISVQRLQARTSNTGYELCEVIICGSAFLWHQVRCLVAVLFLIGQQLEAPEVIDWMLDITQCPRRPQYNMASELPLVLCDCGFENINWIYESGCVQSTVKLLQSHWTTHAVRSAIAEALITMLSEFPISQEKLDSVEVPFSKRRPMPANHAKSLVQGIPTEKSYTKLMKRKTCDSLEEKLRTVNAKKQRTGKPLITMETDLTLKPEKSN